MKTLRTIAMAVVAIVLLAGGFLAAQALPGMSMFGSKSESSNTQVIQSITREEQVVLVGLGIEGISQESKKGDFFGIEIPGSDRAVFLRYSFTAKLGLEGKDVTIAQTGENAYTISVPQFIFIGHADPKFETAAQTSGVLSWTTPEISPVEMINKILNDEAKAKYLKANDELLRDQARSFYTNIIRGIEPEAVLTFTFAGPGA